MCSGRKCNKSHMCFRLFYKLLITVDCHFIRSANRLFRVNYTRNMIDNIMVI